MSLDHVRQVIDRVTAEGFTVFDHRTGRHPAVTTPTPVSAAALDRAALPNGAPLPATWRAWLAFDGSWLQRLGWFSSLEPLTWTPRTLHAIAKTELGNMWAQYYPKRRFDHCFLLPGGSDSRRVLALTAQPDAEGEHPVLWLDVDDMPAMGVWTPGLDLYLAWAAGITEEPAGANRTYSDWARLPFAKARSQHHVRHLTNGDWDIEFPHRLDDAPAKPTAKTAAKSAKPAKKTTAKPKPTAKPAMKKPTAKPKPTPQPKPTAKQAKKKPTAKPKKQTSAKPKKQTSAKPKPTAKPAKRKPTAKPAKK